MSEKVKKTSKTSKKTNSKEKVSVEENAIEKIEVKEEKMTEPVEQVSLPKEEQIKEPTEKASKVFGNIAAYNWWKKLGLFNIIWTFGVVFLILALTWKGDDVDKINANLIFASIMLAIGLLTIILIMIFYYVKKINSFDKRQELIVMILSFVPLGFISNFVLGSFESKRFFAHEQVTKMGYKKPKFTMPHVYIVLLFIIFLVIVASWIVTWTDNEVNTITWTLSKADGTTATLKAALEGKKWTFSQDGTGTELSTIISALNSKFQNGESGAAVKSGVLKYFSESNSNANGWILDPSKVTSKSNLATAGFLYLLVAPIEGFKDAADLVIFLMIMGGFLAIVTESGALEAGLGRMVKKLQGKEIILIPILFVLFSVGGATYGMAEETIPFYLLLIPVFMAAGFDVYTAFITILFGAGLGTAASILNPFVVNSATSAVTNASSWTDGAISPSIGIAWRSVIYVALVILGASYTTWYGWRVKKHPEKSAVYDLRKEHEKQFSFNLDSLPEFTTKRKIILALFALTFLSMIISVISWGDVANTSAFVDATAWIDKYFPFLGGLSKDNESLIGAWGTWYLIQMSFLFLLSSIVIGLLSWKGSLHFISKFMTGAADFIGVGFVIAISRGISIIVSKTGLDKNIIDGLSSIMGSIGNAYGIIIVLFLIFFLLSFLIPSTSGFASAVFPLIGPAIFKAGIPGLTISGAIGTFSMASGIVNVSMPSGGIFMSALSVSNVPIGKFYKNSWHFLLAFFGIGLVMLIIGVAVNGSTSGIGGIF